MKRKIVYVERKAGIGVSIEKAFRQIASSLGANFETSFHHAPFASGIFNVIRNLLFLRPPSADIYHITGDINYVALLFPPERTVLSIMDIRYVHQPKRIRRYFLKKLYLEFPLRRLRYVTAISEQIRHEIVEHTGCDPAKVRVLDLPLLDHLTQGEARPFTSDRPVLLQIGTIPNKNILRLAKALKGIPCVLRIVGPVNTEQSAALKTNGVESVSLKGLSDDEMVREYQNADIVVYCSTYEGFGLPIIEGQSMKKPVLTSNISPMKETAGDGACFVDPFDHKSIRSGLLRIIEDEGFRTEIVAKGLDNIKRFDPHTVATQYELLYTEMLGAAEPSHD